MPRRVARSRRRGDSTATARAVAPGGLTAQAEQAHQRPRCEHEGGSRETEKEPRRSRARHELPRAAATGPQSRRKKPRPGRAEGPRPASSRGSRSYGWFCDMQRRVLKKRIPSTLRDMAAMIQKVLVGDEASSRTGAWAGRLTADLCNITVYLGK